MMFGMICKRSICCPVIPEDRIRCYSCVYSESHGATFGDPGCINPRTSNATELRCNGVCKVNIGHSKMCLELIDMQNRE